MGRVLFLLGLTIVVSCGGSSRDEDYERVCGTYNGRTLYTGPKGGCYYKQTDGEKTYVDRSYCKCY